MFILDVTQMPSIIEKKEYTTHIRSFITGFNK